MHRSQELTTIRNPFQMALIGPVYGGLMRERDASKVQIRIIYENVLEHGANWSVAMINSKLDVVETYWQRFQNAQSQLQMEHADVEVVADSLTQIESQTAELYAVTKAEMCQLKTAIQAAVVPPPRAPRASEVKLSTFRGSYTDWAAWRAEFSTKVLQTAMEPSEQIGLLFASLSGEAATCVSRAERLDKVELDRMWSKLEKTYDNTYQQVYAHISKMIDVPAIGQSSESKLRQMIDIVDGRGHRWLELGSLRHFAAQTRSGDSSPMGDQN